MENDGDLSQTYFCGNNNTDDAWTNVLVSLCSPDDNGASWKVMMTIRIKYSELFSKNSPKLPYLHPDAKILMFNRYEFKGMIFDFCTKPGPCLTLHYIKCVKSLPLKRYNILGKVRTPTTFQNSFYISQKLYFSSCFLLSKVFKFC